MISSTNPEIFNILYWKNKKPKGVRETGLEVISNQF
jgi:hypothetical protein